MALVHANMIYTVITLNVCDKIRIKYNNIFWIFGSVWSILDTHDVSEVASNPYFRWLVILMVFQN
jgi:hypothetical protein